MATKKELEEQVKELKATIQKLLKVQRGLTADNRELEKLTWERHAYRAALEQVLVAPQSEARDVAKRALDEA